MDPTTEDVQLELSFSTCVEPTAAYRTAEEDVAELEAADAVRAGEENVSATSQMTFVFEVRGRGWRRIGVLVVRKY